MSEDAEPESTAAAGDSEADNAKTLADMFKLHASKASGSEATSADISKWCKDAGLTGKTCDTGHVDISFTKVKPKTAKTITFKELEPLIDELAKKYKDDHKLDEEAAKQQIAHKLAATKPKTHGTTKVSKAGGVSRLTDVKGYTGTHQQRFDESGKGRGKEGRADVAKNTGYVGNYKNEGTYGGSSAAAAAPKKTAAAGATTTKKKT